MQSTGPRSFFDLECFCKLRRMRATLKWDLCWRNRTVCQGPILIRVTRKTNPGHAGNSLLLEFGARGAGRAEILSGLTQGLPMCPGRTFVAMAEEERFELS
jgi:hypothetical protein